MNCLNYIRCLSRKECKAYQYNEDKEINCILFHRSCGSSDGQVFQQSDRNHIYEKGLLLESNYQNATQWLIYMKTKYFNLLKVMHKMKITLFNLKDKI